MCNATVTGYIVTSELIDGMNDLIWGIDQDGYEINEVQAKPAKIDYGLMGGVGIPAYVTIRSLVGPIKEHRPHHDFPGLFFHFANTPSEPEALKGFVSKHGLLTHQRAGMEVISNLIQYQDAFRQVIEAYDGGNKAQADKLYEQNLQPKLKIRITRINPTRTILRIAPVNLLGLMWLQLGQYIAGKANFAQCANCGDPFRRKRTSRKTCSDACRQALFRKKGDTQ